jgi:ribosomal protein L37AE/L43A
LTVWAGLRQDRGMASVIERAASGRAKCRACGQAIAKGNERFGEALPNAYGEGESLFWFHLRCAACCRPDSLLSVLEQGLAAPAESEELRALARDGVLQPRLSRILRAERASSGRARCRHCRELIEQGAWRLALQMFEEGRFNSIGTIHASCAVHYFGAEPTIERLTLPSNQLDSDELAEVVASMREGATRPIQPGLAKASSEDPERESSRKSS